MKSWFQSEFINALPPTIEKFKAVTIAAVIVTILTIAFFGNAAYIAASSYFAAVVIAIGAPFYYKGRDNGDDLILAFVAICFGTDMIMLVSTFILFHIYGDVPPKYIPNFNFLYSNMLIESWWDTIVIPAGNFCVILLYERLKRLAKQRSVTHMKGDHFEENNNATENV